jgi:hypothetical protein
METREKEKKRKMERPGRDTSTDGESYCLNQKRPGRAESGSKLHDLQGDPRLQLNTGGSIRNFKHRDATPWGCPKPKRYTQHLIEDYQHSWD